MGLDWSMKGMPLPHVHCSVHVCVYLKCMCFTHAHAHGLLQHEATTAMYVSVNTFRHMYMDVYAQCRNGCYQSDHMFNLTAVSIRWTGLGTGPWDWTVGLDSQKLAFILVAILTSHKLKSGRRP